MAKKTDATPIDYDHATFVCEDTVKHGNTEIKRKYYSVVDVDLYSYIEEEAKKIPDSMKVIPTEKSRAQSYQILKEDDEKLIVENDEIVSIVYLHIPPNAKAVNDMFYIFTDFDPFCHLKPIEKKNKTTEFGTADGSSLFIRRLQEQRGLIPDSRITDVGKTTTNPKETIPRNWSAYTKGQQAEFALFRYYLKGLLDLMKTDEDYIDKPVMGRPPIPDSDMLFYMIDRVHHNLSMRRYHPFEETAVQDGFTSFVPSQAKLSDSYVDDKFTEILNDLLMISATPLVCVEHHFSADASGFRTTRYSDWFGEKHKVKQKNIWKKMHIVIGTKTNIICAIRITDSNVADTVEFPALLNDVSKFFNIEIVSADKGYLSAKNFDYAKEHDIKLYIPFKKNTNPFTKNAQSWRDMYDYALEKPEEFLNIYHKRSNVESTFSSIKQKLGETVRSKTAVGEQNYLLCKAICYNLTMLIMATYTLGIVPDFVKKMDVEE